MPEQLATYMQQDSFRIPESDISEYHYQLPDERIATFPLGDRSASKLMVCDARNGEITHSQFANIPDLLPEKALLVLNDTRVVRARLILHKPTGGKVEMFLIDPVEPSNDPAVALAARGQAVWKCMVGGARKIRGGGSVEAPFPTQQGHLDGRLAATVIDAEGQDFLVRFSWLPAELSFAEVLDAAGNTPLPPYIKRAATESDAETYQTVYAVHEGAVAAPTAGLHFTSGILGRLRQKGAETVRVTLHVGAGTFKQVKQNIAGHDMHHERIIVSASALGLLLLYAEERERGGNTPIIPVGTTSLRTLESLYWFGVRLMVGDVPNTIQELEVGQWDPYRLGEGGLLPTLVEALTAVEEWRGTNNVDMITGGTRLLIVPGYRFHACDALITNFHQPGSTLILLVGALMGKELWSRAYREALERDYRFLSYGDSSLIIIDRFPEIA